jgi:hypothetical protein
MNRTTWQWSTAGKNWTSVGDELLEWRSNFNATYTSKGG